MHIGLTRKYEKISPKSIIINIKKSQRGFIKIMSPRNIINQNFGVYILKIYLIKRFLEKCECARIIKYYLLNCIAPFKELEVHNYLWRT